MSVTYYLFTDIPGSGKDWRLAVLATSKRDATQYVKHFNGGGRLYGEVTSGKVDADCGAVTEAAELEIRSRQNDE